MHSQFEPESIRIIVDLVFYFAVSLRRWMSPAAEYSFGWLLSGSIRPRPRESCSQQKIIILSSMPYSRLNTNRWHRRIHFDWAPNPFSTFPQWRAHKYAKLYVVYESNGFSYCHAMATRFWVPISQVLFSEDLFANYCYYALCSHQNDLFIVRHESYQI